MKKKTKIYEITTFPPCALRCVHKMKVKNGKHIDAAHCTLSHTASKHRVRQIYYYCYTILFILSSCCVHTHTLLFYECTPVNFFCAPSYYFHLSMFNNKSLLDKTIEFIYACKQYFHRSESLINDRTDTHNAWRTFAITRKQCKQVCIKQRFFCL